jgi:hypothetical protein
MKAAVRMTTFQDDYPIVTEAGPGGARICIAITNIKPSVPGRSAVSRSFPSNWAGALSGRA